MQDQSRTGQPILQVVNSVHKKPHSPTMDNTANENMSTLKHIMEQLSDISCKLQESKEARMQDTVAQIEWDAVSNTLDRFSFLFLAFVNTIIAIVIFYPAFYS